MARNINAYEQITSSSGGPSELIGMSAFTVCSWMKFVGSVGQAYYLASNDAFTVGYDGGFVAYVYASDASGFFGNAYTPTQGDWYHVCWRWDPTIGLSIDINGANQYFTAFSTTGTTNSSSAHFRIGAPGTTGMDIDIAECAVWDTYLSDEDVAALGAGASPSLVSSKPLLYYRLFESASADARDYGRAGWDLPADGNAQGVHPPIHYQRTGRLFAPAGSSNGAVAMGLISAGAAANALTVAPSSAAALTMGLLDAAASPYGMTVAEVASQPVTLGLIDSDGAPFSVAIAPSGAVAVGMGLIDTAAAPYGMAIAPANSAVEMALLDAAGAPYSMGLSPAAVSVTLGLLDAVSDPYALTVGPAAASVVLDLLDAAAAPEAISVTPAASGVDLGFQDAASTSNALTVAPSGSVGVGLGLQDAEAATYALTVGAAASQLTLGFLDAAAATYDMTIAPGAQALTMGLIDSAGAPYALDITPKTPVLASYATSSVENATSITLTAPSGITAGDLLVLLVGNDEFTAGHTYSTPSGWNYLGQVGNTTSDCHAVVYWKEATGSETDQTVTCTSTVDHAGWFLRITGANTSDPFPDTFSSAVSGGTLLPSLLTRNTSVDNSLCLAWLIAENGSCLPFTVDAANGWVEHSEVQSGTGTGNVAGVLATKAQLTAGATGDCDVTMSASDGFAGMVLPVAPRGLRIIAPLIDSAGAPYSMTLAAVSSAVTMGVIDAAAAPYSATVAPASGIGVTLPALDAAAATYSLTVGPGNDSVTMALLDSAGAPYGLTIGASGSVGLTMALLDAAGAPYSIALSTGIQEVTMGLIDSAASLFSMTVEDLLQALDFDVIGASAGTYPLRILDLTALETAYSGLEDREQSPRKAPPRKERRRLIPPRPLTGWDVPEQNKHLAEQLTQFARSMTEQLPGEIDQALASESELEWIVSIPTDITTLDTNDNIADGFYTWEHSFTCANALTGKATRATITGSSIGSISGAGDLHVMNVDAWCPSNGTITLSLTVWANTTTGDVTIDPFRILQKRDPQ